MKYKKIIYFEIQKIRETILYYYSPSSQSSKFSPLYSHLEFSHQLPKGVFFMARVAKGGKEKAITKPLEEQETRKVITGDREAL